MALMHAVLVRWSKHHKRRIPKTIEGILRHAFLVGCAFFGHLDHDVIALALVKALFFADPHHGAGIRAIGQRAFCPVYGLENQDEHQ